MRVIYAAFSALLAICGTHAEPCPEMPPPVSKDRVSDLLKDSGVKSGLEQVQSLLTQHASNLPSGMVATIVYDQETILQFSHGSRNISDASSAPLETSNLMRIASISKVFTDVLLYQLRDAGIVGLDDKVADYVPGFNMKKAPGSATRRDITLRGCSSHTSGLPREVPYPCNFGTRCNESEVLNIIKDEVVLMPPNRRFHYSNLGMALLGRALGHASGSSDAWAYESQVKQRILEPLGMKYASFYLDETTKARMGVGTGVDGSAINLSHTCNGAHESEVAWCGPCGCLWASADDIGELMKLFHRDDRPADAGKQVLDGDSIHEMMAPAVLLRDGTAAVGSPFEIQYSSGVWIKSKQGQFPGYRSSMSLVPELKLGIFVSALVSDVEDENVWTIAALDILIPLFKSALWRLAPVPTLPANYTALVGKYAISDGYYDTSVTVEVVGGQLIMNEGGGPNDILALSVVDGFENVLRVHIVNSTESCMWLDNGDQEFAYFNILHGQVESLRWMGGLYGRMRDSDSESVVV